MSGTSETTKIYLTLSITNEVGIKQYYARIDLYQDIYAYGKLSELSAESNSKVLDYLYNDGIFYNWNIGYLKNAIQFVNDKLSKSETHWIYENIITNDFQKIKNETLYILDYSINMQLMDKSNEKRFIKHEKKILGNYPYQYKIIDSKELDKMIISKESFLYLTCIKSGSNKFITITDANSSKKIYLKYIIMGLSPGMKKGHFDGLVKDLK